MKKRKITFISLIYIMSIVHLGSAQQTLVPVEGIDGGTVNCIYTTENGKTLIGTDGGVYALNEDLEEWELKSNGIDFSQGGSKIDAIIEVDGNLFAASEYNTGVYFSDNDGESWSKKIIMLGEYETGYLKSFAYTEFKGKKIIYGASGSAIFKSEDAGMNWQYLKANLSGMGSPIVISDDGDVYSGNWSSNSPSMYRATLENDTVWHHFQAMFESGSCTQLLSYGSDTLFAIFHNSNEDSYTLIQSQSDGRQGTWNKIITPFGADSANIKVVKLDENQHLWAVSEHGSAFRSVNGGRDWEVYQVEIPIEEKSAQIRNNLKSSGAVSIIKDIDIKNESSSVDIDLLIGSRAGVHRGSISGSNIRIRGFNNKLNAVDIVRGTSHNGAIYGMDARGGVFQHLDHMPDAMFEKIPELYPVNATAANPNTNVLMLAGPNGIACLEETGIEPIEVVELEGKNITGLEYGEGIKPSLFAGFNDLGAKVWVSKDDGVSFDDFAELELEDVLDMIMYGDKLMVSSSYGNVASINPDNALELTYEITAGFDIMVKYKESIYARSWNGIYFKKDPESNFEKVVDRPVNGSFIWDMDVVKSGIMITFSDKISEYNSDKSELNDLEIVFDDVFTSGDFGSLIVEDFKKSNLKSASVDDPDMYVAIRNAGLWKVEGTPSTSTGELSIKKISGMYPNPIKSYGTIFFDLKDVKEVQLHIYNMSGQLVRTLANHEMAAGNYRFTWNGKDGNLNALPNGQYVYHLSIGNQHESQKIVLMKD